MKGLILRALPKGQESYGYDKRVVGRIVVEQDEPRTAEADAIIADHMAWLDGSLPSARPADYELVIEQPRLMEIAICVSL